jgi:hypothetical protein
MKVVKSTLAHNETFLTFSSPFMSKINEILPVDNVRLGDE